jgi:hypothetical protein
MIRRTFEVDTATTLAVAEMHEIARRCGPIDPANLVRDDKPAEAEGTFLHCHPSGLGQRIWHAAGEGLRPFQLLAARTRNAVAQDATDALNELMRRKR